MVHITCISGKVCYISSIAKKERSYQPSLWPEKAIPDNETHSFKNTVDPEKKLFQLGKDLNSRFYRHKNSPITAEISQKILELRNRIGLPIARGKNPHVNDHFYQYLVKRVYTFNTFGIFTEYDRAIGEVPPELDLKIKQVTGLVDQLLNKNLKIPERYKQFNQFVQEHQDKQNSITYPTHQR